MDHPFSERPWDILPCTSGQEMECTGQWLYYSCTCPMQLLFLHRADFDEEPVAEVSGGISEWVERDAAQPQGDAQSPLLQRFNATVHVLQNSLSKVCKNCSWIGLKKM